MSNPPGFIRRFVEMMRLGTWGSIFGTDMTRGVGVPVTLTAAGTFVEGDPSKFAPDEIWKSQPHLRTVVSFIAESVAGLGLHAFKVDGDERERLREGDLNSWIRKPNKNQTMTEFVEHLVGELALYDVAWVWVYPEKETGRHACRVIPTKWVQVVENAFGIVKEVSFQDPYDDGITVKIPANEMCRFYSWAAGSMTGGSSRVDTLRLILAEQHAAWVERHQTAQKRGRFGGFFTRPVNAPVWDDAARKKFIRMAQDFTGDGPRAGDDMLLEDGITYQRATRTPAESQWSDSVTLSLVTCAQVFHINPVMVGILDNANYSNAKEFRSALYTDTLGPILRKLEDRMNNFLLPMLGFDPDEVFVEFNVDMKLRGSFMERATIMSKAVGGPWMTRNEARKIDNRKPLPEGDELIVPANVIVGGLASPEDGGEGRPPEGKGAEVVIQIAQEWADRVKRSAMSKRKAGVASWWQPERWRRELEADLTKAGINEEYAAFAAARCIEEAEEHLNSGLDNFDPLLALEE